MRREYLIAIIIVLMIIAGIVGYFAGSAAVPPAQTVTTTVTKTVTAGAPGATTTVTKTKTVTVTATAPGKVTPKKVYKFRMVSHFVAGDLNFEIVKYFTELVRNLSGGRLVIELYPAGELFPVSQTLEQVARGTVEFAEVYTGYWTGEDPVLALAGDKPGPLKHPYEVLFTYYKVEDLIAKHLEAFGVKYIAPLSYSIPDILVSREPIRSLKDLKGKIVRSSGLSMFFYEALGAKTVTLMAGEIYQALQLGTVDAAEYDDFTSNYRQGFHEVAKYVLVPPPGGCLHADAIIDTILIANPKVWEELPDDLKYIIKVAANATLTYSIVVKESSDIIYRQKWIEAGAKIYTLPPEEVPKTVDIAIKIYVEQAKRGPDALEYVLRLAKAWKALGYDLWHDKLMEALRKEGLLKG